MLISATLNLVSVGTRALVGYLCAKRKLRALRHGGWGDLKNCTIGPARVRIDQKGVKTHNKQIRFVMDLILTFK